MPFSFEDCSSAFVRRVNGKAIGFEAFQDIGNFTDMRGPIGVKDTAISSKKCSAAESEPSNTSDMVA
jgi:hypothetical protein